jgi:pimeloyl-ACP methyl ester carboxylesterase
MLEGLHKNGIFESPNTKKESLLINGVQVDTVDVTPENQKDDVPVLLVPGWGATMESFEPGIKVLADKKRRVISLNQPRKGEITPDTYPDPYNKDAYNQDVADWYRKKGKDYPSWPAEFLRQASTQYGLIEQKKLPKVDAIAHSMGVPVVCITAMLHLEKFVGRTLVLENPVGLIGEDSLLRLQRGAGANKSRTETMSEIRDKSGKVVMPEIPVTEAETKYLESTTHITPDYMKENPLRALKETIAISQTQIEDMLQYLHEKGVRIIIVGAVDDTMFPMNDESLRKRGMQQHVKADFIDGFLSVRGGHMGIQTHPEIFMAAAESMLEQPKKKEKPKN